MTEEKKSSAIEWLMTYGWAILVVLVAIGMLAYFGVFNFEKESFCEGINFTEFRAIAVNSECGEYGVTKDYQCNENTKTIWIELAEEKEGCSPACVVSIEDKTAEINWRCTGLVE